MTSCRLVHWDVNNEMLPPQNDFYKSVYGSSQIRYDMFTRARQRDFAAKLFLNDYNVISSGQRTNVRMHILIIPDGKLLCNNQGSVTI